MTTKYKHGDPCETGQIIETILGQSSTAVVYTTVDRFVREAALMAELQHPGIVRYVAHGRTADGPYLAMEWLEFTDLAGHLRERAPTQTQAVPSALEKPTVQLRMQRARTDQLA